SWAGYRVGEELSGIGATDAVGRTPAVSGTLEIAGTTVAAAVVEVDLTTVVSDRPQRDGLVRRSLDTQQFPSARFELTEPVTFESLPAAGESVTATVVGAFEIHGASRPVEISLEATWIERVVIVGGTFQISFQDNGIVPPRAPVVLSVEDVGTIELLLNFTR
ncbi:MAG: YceI family protein, partial [Acidimicrobiia bacterium]|nr:YceI family protein [Acidimicrobiia bacterium]